MSKRLKIFVAIYCLIIVFLCVYVPYKYRYAKGEYIGYSFIWVKNTYRYIDTQPILLSIITLSALFVVAYIIELDKKLYRVILIIKKALFRIFFFLGLGLYFIALLIKNLKKLFVDKKTHKVEVKNNELSSNRSNIQGKFFDESQSNFSDLINAQKECPYCEFKGFLFKEFINKNVCFIFREKECVYFECPNCKEIIKFNILKSRGIIRNKIQKKENKTKKKSNIFPLLLILISICIPTTTIFLIGSSPEQSASIIGQAFGKTLIPYVVIYILIWRLILKKKTEIGLILFSFIFFLFSAYLTLTMYYKIHSENRAKKQILSSLDNYVKREKIEQIKDENYSEKTPLLKLVNNYLLQLQEDFNEMSIEIEKQNFESILLPENMEKPEQIAKSQRKIEYILNVVRNYENKLKQRREEMVLEISNLNIPEEIKEKLLKGYNRTKDKGLQADLQLIAMYKKWIYAHNDILEFLKQNKGKYYIKNDQIIFYDEKDLSTFNEYIQKIDACQKEFNYFNDENVKSNQKVIEELESTFGGK